MEEQVGQNAVTTHKTVWNTVTPFSKYVAMVLLVSAPFIGGWVGYHLAPDKPIDPEVINTISSVDQSATDEAESIPSIPTYFPVTINNWDGPTYKFLTQGDTLYVFDNDPTGLGVYQYVLKGLEPSNAPGGVYEFTYLGGNYMKNDQQVIYIGTNPSIVVDADPVSFGLLERDGGQTFGVDKDSLFYRDEKLSGINPKQAKFLQAAYQGLPIVFENNTFWYPSGSCGWLTYRQGTAEELSTHQFPCTSAPLISDSRFTFHRPDGWLVTNINGSGLKESLGKDVNLVTLRDGYTSYIHEDSADPTQVRVSVVDTNVEGTIAQLETNQSLLSKETINLNGATVVKLTGINLVNNCSTLWYLHAISDARTGSVQVSGTCPTHPEGYDAQKLEVAQSVTFF